MCGCFHINDFLAFEVGGEDVERGGVPVYDILVIVTGDLLFHFIEGEGFGCVGRRDMRAILLGDVGWRVQFVVHIDFIG